MEGKIISVLFSALFDLLFPCFSTVIESVNEDEEYFFFFSESIETFAFGYFISDKFFERVNYCFLSVEFFQDYFKYI